MNNNVLVQNKIEDINDGQYCNCGIQKEEILQRLRKKGFRITKQRKALIDVILDGNCTCCKEIYFLASKKMPEIGIATAYRMLSVLEEVGAIRREGAFQMCCHRNEELQGCEIALDNDRLLSFDIQCLQEVLEKGMEVCGYLNGEKIKTITVKNT